MLFHVLYVNKFFIVVKSKGYIGLNCMTKIFIIYDSQTGNTQTMANAVAEGAKKAGPVEVIIKRVS
jgi:flavorubredoxin